MSEKFTPFQLQTLAAHNRYRQIHGVPPLQLSQRLNDVAQNWATHLANLGRMEHSHVDFENLYWSSENDVPNGATAVDAWYSEIKDYNFNAQGFSPATGHFTAVVWKGITEMGVAKAKGRNGTYVCVNYSPWGNMEGEYEANVFPPQSAPGQNQAFPLLHTVQYYPGRTDNVVTIQPGVVITSTPVLFAPMFGDSPQHINCPHCHRDVITKVSYNSGLATHIIAGVLVVLGCWLGCCLIPYCFDSTKDAFHTCPLCHNFVGKHSRL